MHVTARVASVLFLVAGLAFGGACSNAPSKDDCEKLRDKLIDLEFAAMGAKASDSKGREELAKQKKQTSEGVSERFVTACTKKTPKALIACALEAQSLAAVQECDEKK
jgi:hypothetical protein